MWCTTAYTPGARSWRIRRRDPVDGPLVLFLGRITYQKGPDYFVEAASRVLEKVPNARFVMAGSGDMLPRMKERVKELGIEDSFMFPGFVRGADVEHLFSMADAYVMPSVSEPFGISALEAMSYETPVILSRQSGVGNFATRSRSIFGTSTSWRRRLSLCSSIRSCGAASSTWPEKRCAGCTGKRQLPR